MSNHHFEKWILKTVTGFLLTAGGVFFMYYSLTHYTKNSNWVINGLVSAAGVAVGVLLLSNAAINKMKSDLIKKQKIRQQSGS